MSGFASPCIQEVMGFLIFCFDGQRVASYARIRPFR